MSKLRIRVSLGTLVALNLASSVSSVDPGIAYVMQYSRFGCKAKCAFCTQSSESKSRKDLLSRVIWPVIPFTRFLEALTITKRFKRVCLQTVIKDGFIEEAHTIVKELSRIGINTSLAITPIPKEELIKFRDEGVDYLGVGLDVMSKRLFRALGKPYDWDVYWRFIREGVEIFGERRVIVHVIVGLGETLKEALSTLEKIYDLGAEASLFAFTPIKGTPLEFRSRPNYRVYRLLQLTSELLSRGLRVRDFIISKNGKYYIRSEFVTRDIINKALMTRGCPGCNRPFYNESPGKEPYNFPSPKLIDKYYERIMEEIKDVVV